VVAQIVISHIHGDLKTIKSFWSALARSKTHNEIPSYRFRIRGCVGLLPLPVFVNQRKGKLPPDICPGCSDATSPTTTHILTGWDWAARYLLKMFTKHLFCPPKPTHPYLPLDWSQKVLLTMFMTVNDQQPFKSPEIFPKSYSIRSGSLTILRRKNP
jgi:hypothetical protein